MPIALQVLIPFLAKSFRMTHFLLKAPLLQASYSRPNFSQQRPLYKRRSRLSPVGGPLPYPPESPDATVLQDYWLKPSRCPLVAFSVPRFSPRRIWRRAQDPVDLMRRRLFRALYNR